MKKTKHTKQTILQTRESFETTREQAENLLLKMLEVRGSVSSIMIVCLLLFHIIKPIIEKIPI